MNYIYDILLDFNNILYDFFDWNEEDKIIHVRKIPLIKVSLNTYNDIKYNKIQLLQNELDKIKNKTEIFDNHKIKNIEYACLISNGIEVFALAFDGNGTSNKYSNLLLDENEEVIEVAQRIEESKLEFKIIDFNKKYFYLTRKDISIMEYIDLEINNLKNNKEYEKIKYLYYELFDEKNDDIKIMIDRIKKEIRNTKNDICLKTYNFFKLTSLKK